MYVLWTTYTAQQAAQAASWALHNKRLSFCENELLTNVDRTMCIMRLKHKLQNLCATIARQPVKQYPKKRSPKNLRDQHCKMSHQRAHKNSVQCNSAYILYFARSHPQGQHCPKIMKSPQSLPLQMAERLLRAQPHSVANHVTDRSISDWRALTWLATETGWARSKRSTICSGKLISRVDINRDFFYKNQKIRFFWFKSDFFDLN